MRNLKWDTRFVCTKLLLILFISLSYPAGAQTDFDVVENDSVSFFDPIDTAGLQMVTVRTVGDSALRRLKQDDAFWYANAVFKKPKDQAAMEAPLWVRLLQQQWFRTLLWLIIGGSFVAVLVWYLATLNIQLFRRQPVAIASLKEQKVSENIFSIHYESEIQKAIQERDYRLAVRLLYLQLLVQMSDQKIIQYGQGLTNSAYVAQLYQTGYYHDFFQLTRDFEYTWYGQFVLSPAAFQIIQTNFHHFKQRLSS